MSRYFMLWAKSILHYTTNYDIYFQSGLYVINLSKVKTTLEKLSIAKKYDASPNIKLTFHLTPGRFSKNKNSTAL